MSQRNESLEDIAKELRESYEYCIVFVGDSITEGARATSAEETYVAHVARGLAREYPKRRVIRYDGIRHPTEDGHLLPLLTYGDPIEVQGGEGGTLTVVRSGIGGNTVRRLLNRTGDFIGKEFGGRRADLFILNLGINDALKSDPRKYVTSAVYGEHLNTLLDEMERGAAGTDIILMTPTYNDDGTSQKSHLAPYVDRMRAIAEERRIPLIDLHRAWMDHLTVGGENYGQGAWLSGVVGDLCHPSDTGHEAIARLVLENLKLK